MTDNKEKNELKEEDLEKVNGGEAIGTFVKYDTTYWVCPHCHGEYMATYTFVSKHLFNDHNDIYHFKNWDEAYEFVKTIDWY